MRKILIAIGALLTALFMLVPANASAAINNVRYQGGPASYIVVCTQMRDSVTCAPGKTKRVYKGQWASGQAFRASSNAYCAKSNSTYRSTCRGSWVSIGAVSFHPITTYASPHRSGSW